MNTHNEFKLVIIVAEAESNVQRWLKSVTTEDQCNVQAVIQAEEEPLADFAGRVTDQLGNLESAAGERVARVYWLRGRLIGPRAGAARAIILQAILGRLRNRRDLLTIVPWPGTGKLRSDENGVLVAPPVRPGHD